jgi:hypothetical protein
MRKFYAFLCYLLASCLLGKISSYPAAAQTPASPGDTIAFHYQLPAADCALFPAAASLPAHIVATTTSTGRFTPTRPQVVQAERALRKVSLAQVNPHPETPYYAAYPASLQKQLGVYRRQYYGFYNAQHHACLYINFFIESREEPPGQVPHWLRAPVFFYDGGPALWCIYYDLTLHQFYDFQHSSEG